MSSSKSQNNVSVISAQDEKSYLDTAMKSVNKGVAYLNKGVVDGPKWTLEKIKTFNWVFWIGFLLLVLALAGFITISGAQTGSSQTSGLGSMVISSTNPNGTDMNPTTEVVGEFLCILLLVFGVSMITYSWTTSKIQKELIETGNYVSALVVNGGKYGAQTIKDASNATLAYLINKNKDLVAKIVAGAEKTAVANSEK